MMCADITAEAARLGFELPPDSMPLLAGYLELLMKWNNVMNLVGVSDCRTAFRTLIADSLYLWRFMERTVSVVDPVCWDLGAGAGLPGIPLRTLWACGRYTLVESREKRTLFLKTVLAKYPLKNTFVYRGRAEDFMPAAAPADIIVSRAFMPWVKLLDFVAPYLSPGGQVVLLLNDPIELSDGCGWRIADSMIYLVEKENRVFFALTRRE